MPALIPIFLKGRIKSEDENWLVRTMIEIFKPMLAWLMDRTTLVCWLFVVILGLGYVASTKLGREFMPDLDEQSLMDMPTTVPRASIAEVERDLRVRDEVLRGFPEVWQVVGKAGRAETPTDSAPLDMIETVINLRDHELWPKRKLRFEDAVAQTRVVLDALVAKGLLRRPALPEEREALVERSGDDRRRARSMRCFATWRCGGWRSSARSWAAPWSARRSTPCSAASSPPPSPAS